MTFINLFQLKIKYLQYIRSKLLAWYIVTTIKTWKHVVS